MSQTNNSNHEISNSPIEKHQLRGFNDKGRLHIYFGSMFSGKTTKVIREIVTCYDVGLSVLYINSSKDSRNSNDDHVSSHHSMFNKLPSNINAIKTDLLTKVNVEKYDVIGIDEGQFFNDIVPTVRKWVLKNNKMVIIGSLDGTFDIQPFGHVHELICLAEKVKKLPARCMNCLNNSRKSTKMTLAYFTHRISEEKDNVLIGGADKYMAVCLSCHIKLNQ